jgi:pimeloyl-ACP methyl ester carboxylesterase
MPRVFANGFHLHYEELGAGDPVVFLSGLGGDHRAFAVPLRTFGKSYHALALDNRDAGRSDRAVVDYSTAELADDVAAWMGALNLAPAHIIGQSLGGLVAQELALRSSHAVRSLTLVSTHAGSGAWKKAVVASWVELKRRTGPEDFTRATLPWLVAPEFYENTMMIDGLVRFAARNQWPQEPDAFARQARAATTHDTHARLGKVRAPTLVVVGERDLVNPPEVARELADLIPSARLSVLPGLGHLPHVENIGAFQEVILAFLRDLGDRS